MKPPWGWVPGRQLHTVSFVAVHARLVSLPLPGGTGGAAGPAKAHSPSLRPAAPRPLDAASGPATWHEARGCLAPCPPHPASRTPRGHVAGTCRPPRSPPLGGGRCPGTPGRALAVVWGLWLWLGARGRLSVVGGLTLVALRAGLAGLIVGGLVVVASFALAAPGVLGLGAAALHPEPCRRWACEAWPGPRSSPSCHPESTVPQHPQPFASCVSAPHPHPCVHLRLGPRPSPSAPRPPSPPFPSPAPRPAAHLAGSLGSTCCPEGRRSQGR